MTKPILNPPRVMAGIRQRVPATMPQRVGVNREGQAGSLANATRLQAGVTRRSAPADRPGSTRREISLIFQNFAQS
jgi:hypothetical protein